VEAEQTVKIRPLEVGDAVLFDDELYRLEKLEETFDVETETATIWASLRNENEECETPIENITFVAKDTLSGMKKKPVKYPFRNGDWVRHKKSGIEGSVSHNRAGKTHVRVRGEDYRSVSHVWSPHELESAPRPAPRPLPPFERPYDRQSTWEPPEYQSRRPETAPKPKPEEHDSLSTGALITDEVKRLRQEERQDGTRTPLRRDQKPGTTRKLRTRPPGVPLDTSEQDAPEKPEKAPGIPKRRGDW
jgi:hypothetical protein